MKDRCIAAVSQAIGRQITKAEAKDIEARILRNMRMEARRDPTAWQSMGYDQRLLASAARAGAELKQEALLAKRRMGLAIQAHDRVTNAIAEGRALGRDAFDTLSRLLVFKADAKGTVMSAESRGSAIRADYLRQLIDTFEAVDPRIWGLLEDQDGVKLLTKAMFGEPTGNAKVDAGARAWLDVAGKLRDRFNDAGGKIRELEGWALPQHHSQLKIAKAGRDAWVAEVMPMLDRARYIDENGAQYTDAQLVDMLRSAYLTLATGGLNKIQPGQAMGRGAVANRNAEARTIHFKDADSYLKYQSLYGEKSLWSIITGHVSSLAKEIALLETFGPNPEGTFRLFMDEALRDEAIANPDKAGKLQARANRLQGMYDFMSGNVEPIANVHLAQAFDTLRNWLIASRLGSAAVTAMSDEATLHLTARINNLPEMRLLRNELAALNVLNKTEENLANRAGLAIDTLIGHLNRFGQDDLANTWSNKMASTVMRASGLEALDGARRRAFGTTMLHALGEVVGKYETLADLDPGDNRILLSKGITELDWQVWKLAELEDWGRGNAVLTPEAVMRIDAAKLAPLVARERARIDAEKQAKLTAIDKMSALDAAEKAQSKADWTAVFDEQADGVEQRMRLDAVTRLLGVVGEETDMAVIRPGVSDRYMTAGQFQRGTWKGELARSVFLFKSFPLAVIARHWMRGLNMPTTGGKAAYLASLIVGTTLLGAVADTINDLLQGKDIKNYNPFKEHGVQNWIKAFLKGGSLGLYGDFLFSGATQTSHVGPLAAMLGPVAGAVEETMALTQGNIVQGLQGKDTHFGAEAVRFVRGNLPGASLWYAKAALDHMIFHQMQEYFTPGYLAKMERRARNEFGQDYWWRPGTGINGMRAPRPERALGG